jgi:superfamily II DNA helicase RecQ
MKDFFNSQFSVIWSPTTRPNLSYEVRKVYGKLGATLLKILSLGPTTPKCIIFSRGKPETEEMAKMLCDHGLTAVHYHADLDTHARNTAHTTWTRREVDIMVATGAFGMGVDLPSVRLVVHLNEPYSMIHLAQESGCGGRDGSPSKHIILLSQFNKLAQVETCTKMVEYLGGTKCRHWVLQEYIDGQGLDCFASGSERCDVCESLLNHVQSDLTMTNRRESSTSKSSKSLQKS